MVHLWPLFADESGVGQYLTFRVGRQDFAIDATRVRGLLPTHDMIHVEIPDSHIRGYASILQGEFPVIDLRQKLGIRQGSHGKQPCVVVVEISSGGNRLAGFVADRVSEVIALREREFRNGIARLNGRSRRILDPDQIVTEVELMSLWRPALTP